MIQCLFVSSIFNKVICILTGCWVMTSLLVHCSCYRNTTGYFTKLIKSFRDVLVSSFDKCFVSYSFNLRIWENWRVSYPYPKTCGLNEISFNKITTKWSIFLQFNPYKQITVPTIEGFVPRLSRVLLYTSILALA